MALVTEILKGKKFEWTEAAQKAFDSIKDKLTSAPILALPNFAQVLKVECDASRVRIRVVLTQEGRLVAYFSEKLNDVRRK